MDKGAQSQHTTPSDSLCTYFPSQPAAEPMPQRRCARSPQEACSSRAGHLPDTGAIAAGQESSAYLLFSRAGLCSKAQANVLWALLHVPPARCCEPFPSP